MLLRLILGAAEPQSRVLSGRMLFQGEDLLTLRPRKRRELRRNEMGFIGRKVEEVFNPERTVLQSLKEFSRLSGRRSGLVPETEWSDVFYSVGIVEPERILPRPIGSLSLLMVQKVALMRSLISGARLLVCDDATAELDRVAEDQFLELLSQLREEKGLTILMAMGNLRGVDRFADRLAVFYEGGILESGDAYRMFQQPRFHYTREFLASSPRLGDLPRDLPGISREAVREAEGAVHGPDASGNGIAE